MDIVGLIDRGPSVYGLVFPDLPGCCSAAGSHKKVIEHGMEGLTMFLEAMAERGAPIPDFRSLAEIEIGPDFFAGTKYAAIYTVDMQGQTVSVRVKADHVPLTRRRAATE